MATKRKPTSPKEAEESKRKTSPTTMTEHYSGRNSLGNYIRAPENYDSTRVITYDDEFVVIRDIYPKAQIHYLVLAREKRYARQQHPIEALGDEKFLARMRWQVKQVKEMVVQELLQKELIRARMEEKKEGGGEGEIRKKRNSGNHGGAEEEDSEGVSKRKLLVSRSADSAVGVVGIAATPADDDKQRGRDWDREVMAGIHARPSMNHLHVHVLSIDRHSTWMKHRNHYNSFTTQFFIPIEEFPLAKDDVRRFPDRAGGYLKSDLKCWRCGLNFGNQFSSLKKHLAREFEDWRKELILKKNITL